MKKLIILLSAACLLLGISVASAADMKIGLVDLPKVLQNSPKVAALNKKLQAQFEPQQQKIVALQRTISMESKKLDTLSGAEKTKLETKLEGDQKTLQDMVAKFQASVSASQASAMQDLMDSVNSTVKSIAQAQHLDPVLLKPAVVYSSNSVDITQQVIDQLPK